LKKVRGKFSQLDFITQAEACGYHNIFQKQKTLTVPKMETIPGFLEIIYFREFKSICARSVSFFSSNKIMKGQSLKLFPPHLNPLPNGERKYIVILSPCLSLKERWKLPARGKPYPYKKKIRFCWKIQDEKFWKIQ